MSIEAKQKKRIKKNKTLRWNMAHSEGEILQQAAHRSYTTCCICFTDSYYACGPWPSMCSILIFHLLFQLMYDQAAEGCRETERERSGEGKMRQNLFSVSIHSESSLPLLFTAPVHLKVEGEPFSTWFHLVALSACWKLALWVTTIMSAALGWLWPGWGRKCSSPGWLRNLATP